VNRRALLGSLGGAVAVTIAGCADRDSTGISTDDPPTDESRTADGTDAPTEQRRDGLYEIPGAGDVFAPPSVQFENRSGGATTVTTTVSHDGTGFFDRTLDLAAGEETDTDPILRSEGTYQVTAETAGGQRVSYEWHVTGNWPALFVIVDEDGTLRVGCGPGGEPGVAISNPSGDRRTTTLELRNDDGVVDARTLDVTATETVIRFDVPIGDEYTLAVETDGGRDTGEFVACYCRGSDVSVTLDDGPTVESTAWVCD
jgi:hypothetical protein